MKNTTERQKVYNIQYNIGRCKYVVNYYNGVKTHEDGSKFFDIAIFNAKVKMNAFIKKLESENYINR